MSSRLARRSLVFGAIWVGWTLIAFLALGPQVLARLFRGGPPVPRGLIVYNIEHVWLWAVYTPVILWLAARFPITRRTLWNVPVHIGLALAVQVIDILIDRLILPLCGLRYEESLFTTFAEQLFVNLFCYGAVMLAGLALANARWLNERRLRASQLGAELARAQLRALEMQLRPHFLFNALHSVAALIRAGEAQAAIRILAELGDLLRAILRGDGQHEATVNEELELALQYLRIEEVRFADRVESHVAVTPEALAAFVPRLVLQPLLENAVRHGVERSLGKTRIDLRGTVEGGLVWLSVRDHGGGGARRDGHGIGLANTRARLERLYSDKYRLELGATTDGGFMARVGIPYHLQPVEIAAGEEGRS
jgi:sensor histidine kinase YesM